MKYLKTMLNTPYMFTEGESIDPKESKPGQVHDNIYIIDDLPENDLETWCKDNKVEFYL